MGVGYHKLQDNCVVFNVFSSIILPFVSFCTASLYEICEAIIAKVRGGFFVTRERKITEIHFCLCNTSIALKIRRTATETSTTLQGLLFHRTCKPDFLCSWPSLNSYLKINKGKFLRECCIHDTGTVLKISLSLDRNLAKANCTENQVCMSCDIVVLETLLTL